MNGDEKTPSGEALIDTEKNTEKKGNKKKDPEPGRLSYYNDQKNGGIYLTVIESTKYYQFCFENGGKIDVCTELKIDGKIFKPQQVPESGGQVSNVVLVPQLELIQKAPLLSADALAAEIKAHILKYFDAPPLEIDLFTFYIFFTWFYQKGNVSPYLRFLADLGSGKSRGLDVIGDLCFYRTRLDGGTTLSSIMRMKQQWQGTVIMDEADIKCDSRSEAGGFEDMIVKFFNLGFERGRPMLKTDTKDFSVQEVFDPFCPKILGMRSPFRDGAIESRCLSYSPSETSRNDIPIILPPAYITERDLLVAKLARFALHHWPSVDGFDFISMQEMSIDKRTIQLSSPLSFVVKQLFPDGEETFRRYISQRYQEIRRIRAQSDEGAAFNTLYSIAVGEMNLKGEFPALYTDEGMPIRVTPKMLAAAYGWKSSNRITKKLVDILHFEKHKEKISGRSETVIIVPNDDAWRSAYRRYYYNDDDPDSGRSFIPTIPPALDKGCRVKVSDGPKPGESDGVGSKVPEVPITGGEGVPLFSNNNLKDRCGIQGNGTIGTTLYSDTPRPPVFGTFRTLEPDHISSHESSKISNVSGESDLTSFLRFAGLSYLPNIRFFHRMTSEERLKFGHCIIAGCQNPKLYADQNGQQFLCEIHYLMIRKKFFIDNKPEPVHTIIARPIHIHEPGEEIE